MDTTVVENPNLENVAAMTVAAWSTRMQAISLHALWCSSTELRHE